MTDPPLDLLLMLSNLIAIDIDHDTIYSIYHADNALGKTLKDRNEVYYVLKQHIGTNQPYRGRSL